MYQYPLTFTFPAFSVSPQITVKDAGGAVVLTAAKKLISSKEEINVTLNGKPVYSITSQESRITDIPSNWDVKTADGFTLGVVDDDFLSAVDTSKFISNSTGAALANTEISRALNLRAVKMYWINDTKGKHLGFIAPDQKSLVAMQLPFGRFIRQLPALFFRFITPSYYVRLGEETMMFMQKKRTFMLDTYTLEKRGNFTDADEPLLVNSVLLALVYERQNLKDMYS
ncbi:MAG: hypothetical protein PHQ36_02895 [Anaerolineales bacterium]|nr:hypothetical protein [Anaerolineales bacterium]